MPNDASARTGVALCLSGGGYRAVLFNAGSVLRLAEAGLLGSTTRLCGVSGGAIVAGLLAVQWGRLAAEQFAPAAVLREVIGPLRALASRTLDGRSVVGGLLFPRSLTEWISHNFDRALYHGVQFGDLAVQPGLSIGASQLNSGTPVLFSTEARKREGTISIGDPTYPITDAVCASISMPPAFPALRVSESDGAGDAMAMQLADGALCNPLALVDADDCGTLWVSDGAGAPGHLASVDGKTDQSARANEVLLEALRAARAHSLQEGFRERHYAGAYWSLRATTADYPADTCLVCPPARAAELAALPTRFAGMDPALQERLVNWGYAICDLALRSWHDDTLVRPAEFPYRDRGL
ncbi:MAG: patatin-like phospholipase family protein [Proteobacteria bacterium]|nr:patatin-like phospholipase family protein [Burkholderiales bacterium]